MNIKIKSENTRNAVMVVSSNLLTILIALIMGFVIPKQISVTDYAYYHVYCLYIAYAGFFHFGLVNGIYLKYGHLNEDELPVDRFRTYSRIMFALQAAITVILMILLCAFHPADKKTDIAYAFVILNIPLINIKWFYSSINQFTKRFVIDSLVTYIQNALTLVMLIVIIRFRLYYFEALLILTTLINLICMWIVMYQNKGLIGRNPVMHVESDIKPLIQSGFILMLSEFIGIILLGIDSMFVQKLYTVNEFAMYSFAISVIAVMYTLISTVSNLIYPYLVRAREEKYAEYYTWMSNALSVVTVFSMLAFYAAKLIIDIWLDKYTSSILVMSILFGTVIFRSLIMLVCGNYFKVLKMMKEYTKNNIFAIVISFFLDLFAYLIFKEYYYIAVASLLSFIVWYIVTDLSLISRLNISKMNGMRRYICIAMSLTVFYLLLYTPDLVGFFAYMMSVCLICLMCFLKQFKALAAMMRNGIVTGKGKY